MSCVLYVHAPPGFQIAQLSSRLPIFFAQLWIKKLGNCPSLSAMVMTWPQTWQTHFGHTMPLCSVSLWRLGAPLCPHRPPTLPPLFSLIIIFSGPCCVSIYSRAALLQALSQSTIEVSPSRHSRTFLNLSMLWCTRCYGAHYLQIHGKRSCVLSVPIILAPACLRTRARVPACECQGVCQGLTNRCASVSG